jgi:hypothetical protein
MTQAASTRQQLGVREAFSSHLLLWPGLLDLLSAARCTVPAAFLQAPLERMLLGGSQQHDGAFLWQFKAAWAFVGW